MTGSRIPALVRGEVLARDRWCCTRCWAPINGGRSYSIHHRTARGMGGTSDPVTHALPNLVTLCGSGTTLCHGWVESHREEARQLGFLVTRGVDPTTRPILLHGRVWAYLGADGSIHPPHDR